MFHSSVVPNQIGFDWLPMEEGSFDLLFKGTSFAAMLLHACKSSGLPASILTVFCGEGLNVAHAFSLATALYYYLPISGMCKEKREKRKEKREKRKERREKREERREVKRKEKRRDDLLKLMYCVPQRNDRHIGFHHRPGDTCLKCTPPLMLSSLDRHLLLVANGASD